MWFSQLALENVRSFEKANLKFSTGINLLIGPNNCGKSTILLPLLSLQAGLPSLTHTDIRLGSSNGVARIYLGDADEFFPTKAIEGIDLNLTPQDQSFQLFLPGPMKAGAFGRFPNTEPRNAIYPFLSRRKNPGYSEQVNESIVNIIPLNFENLNSKIDRLGNSEFQPAHNKYMKACDEILGFKVTTIPAQQGKRAVLMVNGAQSISLLAMGEGIINILGLIVHLALAKNRVFILEEPENDIHPRALKALLTLIAEKSAENQFIVTTHSNIVLKQLGTLSDTKIFQLECQLKSRLPTSTVHEVGPSPEERRSVLSDLGYELHDVDLWDAWLLMEESSAEKIVRTYLIPWFVPHLQTRLRTYSAHSISEVPSKFQDFNDLLVFLHLEPIYKNRAWVVVDGGPQETEIVTKLREMYVRAGGWEANRFVQLKEHDFEKYYPPRFANEINAALSETDKQARREKKKKLLEMVETWVGNEPDAAKKAFEESAGEVIGVLKEISAKLS